MHWGFYLSDLWVPTTFRHALCSKKLPQSNFLRVSERVADEILKGLPLVCPAIPGHSRQRNPTFQEGRQGYHNPFLDIENLTKHQIVQGHSPLFRDIPTDAISCRTSPYRCSRTSGSNEWLISMLRVFQHSTSKNESPSSS